MKKKRWMLFLAWLGFTIFLCAESAERSSALSGTFTEEIYHLAARRGFELDYATLHHYLRKFAHVGVHFMLAVLAYRAVAVSVPKKNAALAVFISLALAGGFAFFDEAMQLLATDRGAGIRDALLNFSGAVLGVASGSFTPPVRNLAAPLRDGYDFLELGRGY